MTSEMIQSCTSLMSSAELFLPSAIAGLGLNNLCAPAVSLLEQCPCWLGWDRCCPAAAGPTAPGGCDPTALAGTGGLSPSLGTQAAGRDRDSLSLCSAGSVPGTAELRCRGQALTHDDTDESIKHSSCGTTRHWHITTTPRAALGRGQRGGG